MGSYHYHAKDHSCILLITIMESCIGLINTSNAYHEFPNSSRSQETESFIITITKRPKRQSQITKISHTRPLCYLLYFTSKMNLLISVMQNYTLSRPNNPIIVKSVSLKTVNSLSTKSISIVICFQASLGHLCMLHICIMQRLLLILSAT